MQRHRAATLTIERLNSDIGLPITVNLTSSDTSELRVPASVTIPANASSATVYLDVIDDSLLDGIQLVMLAALLNGYDTGTREVQILDYEKLSVSFNRSTVLENAGEQAALLKVTRPNSVSVLER